MKHSLDQLLVQRLSGIVAGYEDHNDARQLRHDGLFQLLAGKANLGEPLASPPALSRLENSVSLPAVERLNRLLTETFIRSQAHPPVLILEADSTADPAPGQQQLIAFNGFYDQYM